MSNKSVSVSDKPVDDNNNPNHANETADSKEIRIASILDSASCQESTDDTTSICSEGLFLEEVYYTPSTSTPQTLSPSDPWTNDGELKTLIVADPSEGAKLRELISQVVVDHDVQAYRHEETFDACNNNVYQLIWMKMTVPANQEILSLSTSIRYASKSNRGTVILGLADTQPDVDLRLHGIDEVLVGPLNKSIVRQKYLKWTSVQTAQGEDCNLLMSECPKTPTTPSSVCSDTMASTLNASPDLNLTGTAESRVTAQSSGSEISTNGTPVTQPASPSGTTSTVLSSLRTFDLQSVNYNPRPARASMAQAADHTTKEKLRRERIKDSCDQLRVLLPYIRGRKTDMASILEMTVDYLKIVNAAIPQDFQNQVINLMSKGTVLPKGKGEGRGRRSGRRDLEPPESPSATRVSSTVDAGGRGEGGSVTSGSALFDMGIHHSHNSLSPPARPPSAQMTMAGTKRDSGDSFKDLKSSNKRMHLSPHPISSPSPTPTPAPQGLVYIQSEADSRADPNDLCRDTSSPLHIQGVHLQSHMYSDLDTNANRRYSNTFIAPDTYPMTTSVGGATTRMSNLERDAYGMYVENFYQYYSGQQASSGSYGAGSLSDYVNPNAVLPVTYSSRMVGNRKYDEQERFSSVSGTDELVEEESWRNTFLQ